MAGFFNQRDSTNWVINERLAVVDEAAVHPVVEEAVAVLVPAEKVLVRPVRD
jgi:hypothetical protein